MVWNITKKIILSRANLFIPFYLNKGGYVFQSFFTTSCPIALILRKVYTSHPVPGCSCFLKKDFEAEDKK